MSSIERFVKKILNPSQKEIMRRILYFLSPLFSSNLLLLAKICETDKWGFHWYAQHYQSHFKSFKKKKLNLLEIGVGGYDNPNEGGSSLRMWKRYFPKGNIYALDIHEKGALQENRIKIFEGSQIDEKFLQDTFNKIGSLDIIIDDGSHINQHMITTFKILFPLLKNGGIYVIEDLETSYWPDFGGDSSDLNNPNTAMNYFKSLADGLHYRELLKPDYVPTYFDQNIVAIHFYHNLIFVYKGKNDENEIRWT